MKRILAIGLFVVLSACGGRQMLKPPAGKTLPPKPEAAMTVPTPDALMTADDQARPQRNDELLLKSEKRRDDAFDLPPKG